MLGLIDPAPHSKIGQNTFLQWKVKRLRCTGRKYGQKIVRNHLKKWWEVAPFSRVAYSFGKASIGSIIDEGSKQSAKSNFSLVN